MLGSLSLHSHLHNFQHVLCKEVNSISTIFHQNKCYTGLNILNAKGFECLNLRLNVTVQIAYMISEIIIKNDNVIDYNKILNIDLACHVTANM